MRLPIKMPDLPPHRESVEKAVSAENLRVMASATSDPVVLLGLAFLARSGAPVRKEIGEMAVRARSDYAPIVAVLSVMMDRIDEESVGELVQRDPDNALGHYLNGALLHVANREGESLDVFRKAAACSEMRFYDSTTGEALFKALDVLGLQGLDRLCALSWVVSRWGDFSSVGIQPTYQILADVGRNAEPATRAEVAEILLTLAGHLFAANFTNRWFAQRAVEAAFTIKAKLAGAGGHAEAERLCRRSLRPDQSDDLIARNQGMVAAQSFATRAISARPDLARIRGSRSVKNGSGHRWRNDRQLAGKRPG